MSFSWLLLLKGLPESELRQADVPGGLYVVPHVGGHGHLVFIRVDHAGALKGLYNFYLPTIFIPFVDQRRDALIPRMGESAKKQHTFRQLERTP